MSEAKDPVFTARLKELRRTAGLSQEQLARAAGLTLGGVTKLEQGVTAPTWATVRALAKALGVSCAAFEEAPARGAGPAARGRPRKPGPRR